MDSIELGRRLKRHLDIFFSYRRITFVVLTLLVFFVYIVPFLFRRFDFHRSPSSSEDEIDSCIQDRLTSFYSESFEYNVNIRHVPPEMNEKPYVAYVGNGVFGIEINKHSQMYIRHGRTLSLHSLVHPIVYLQNYYMSSFKEAIVTNYLTGIVHVFQCYKGGVYASYQYYAHRTYQTVFVQDIKVSNPTDVNLDIVVNTNKVVTWPNAVPVAINIKQGDNLILFNMYTGYINVSDSEVVAISVATRNYPMKVVVEARRSKNLHLLTSLNYSTPVKKSLLNVKKQEVEKSVIENLKKALGQDPMHLKENHAKIWQELWSTGLTIGTSKAKDALNGDKINATMYYVLSQVRVRNEFLKKDSADLTIKVSDAEGCYGDYHTLEAKNLWGNLETIEDINEKAKYWLLSLEKHGCHNMLKTGAHGVVQAMVLSFGGLRFSNQHLEFNIHPKYLHREYLFRHINYGNLTHVNISVVLKEDLKTVIDVSIDRSGRNYYACDAGCHNIMQLGPEKRTFPVKLTQPLTAILYITYDKQHMEDLRHAIHVVEIAEAPPHEHHLIALHQHGHHLGGLPTFFWITVSLLILIFHLFLFKLIYNEYCSGAAQEKHRFRYGKL
ncbi:hypothetical protein RUM43_004648 [Polyplax serrata]|uniref:Uncharacterized protein n=1 Tax=Polyplax serrata TaxID=468196 RepID=A0AAN8SDL7_POLSC